MALPGDSGLAGAPETGAVAVERLLESARRRLRRLEPGEVPAELQAGAALLDIRPESQRSRDGGLPGAIVVCRNVLEWRCDASSPWCDPRLADPETRAIVICNEGFQSSLAAAVLQDLGREDATDVVGGFAAWRASGLPVLAGVPTPG